MDQTEVAFQPIPPSPCLIPIRPYIHEFLTEAAKLYQLYIYTMGERGYAEAGDTRVPQTLTQLVV